MKRAGLALLVAALCVCTGARAADEVDPKAAAVAYDAAVAAHDRGDFAASARLFAEADSLAPNPVALETAIRDATLANLPDLAMNLVYRARRASKVPPALEAAARDADSRFASRVGVLRVLCEDCTASLDNKRIVVHQDIALLPGSHLVKIRVGDITEEHPFSIGPSEHVELRPERDKPKIIGPVPDPTPPVEPRSGIHPAWLTIGFVATAAFGGAALGSYLDAQTYSDQLQEKRLTGDTEGAQEIADRGQAAEIRTYVFEGFCAASALATIFVAAFAVDWKGVASTKAGKQTTLLLGPANLSLRWQLD